MRAAVIAGAALFVAGAAMQLTLPCHAWRWPLGGAALVYGLVLFRLADRGKHGEASTAPLLVGVGGAASLSGLAALLGLFCAVGSP